MPDYTQTESIELSILGDIRYDLQSKHFVFSAKVNADPIIFYSKTNAEPIVFYPSGGGSKFINTTLTIPTSINVIGTSLQAVFTSEALPDFGTIAESAALV